MRKYCEKESLFLSSASALLKEKMPSVGAGLLFTNQLSDQFFCTGVKNGYFSRFFGGTDNLQTG
jgi:hypothetical protein